MSTMYQRFYALCLTVLMHPSLIANGEVRQNMPSILNDSNGIESTPPNPSNIPDFGTSCQMMSFEENTCIDKKQQKALEIFHNKSCSVQQKAEALVLYLNSIDSLATKSASGALTPKDVDQFIDKLDENVKENSSSILIISMDTTNGNRGILSVNNITKQIITQDSLSLHDLKWSAAIMFDKETINQIRVMIIDEPTMFRNLNDSIEQYLVSSIIIANVTRKDHQTSTINVTWYFRILHGMPSNKSGDYKCSFLDMNTFTWSQFGCNTTLVNDSNENVYKCTCNHLSIYALIWLPHRSQSGIHTSHEIVSLVFLSLSILTFIGVIIHALLIRLDKSIVRFKAHDLLPLVSSAATTILFVFVIVLSMAVYTETSSSSASILMFFVYFFLIFMFCVKTSVGFFNYLRFVYLFPEPSYRKLYILLVISFFLSIGWTSFVAAINANPAFNITQLYDKKIYWFNQESIYYFMNVPITIFLLINIIIIILVARRIIEHVRRATSLHGSYERRKRCILVLLSSCVTQGIGWFFGLFLSLLSPHTRAEKVFMWFFDILNGLEGVWTLLLYIIIRSQRIDESKQVSCKKDRQKKVAIITNENVFNDLYDQESVELEITSVDAEA